MTLRSKVGKGLMGAGVWGGAPVYTSPAPDLQPEQAAPDRACGLRNAGFEPGRALRRGRREADGIENPKIEPARPAGRACRTRNCEFVPKGDAKRR